MNRCFQIFSISFLAAVAASCSSEAPSPPPPSAASAQPPSTSGPALVEGRAPAAQGGLPAIVILDPDAKTPAAVAAPADKPVMDQITMSFIPGVLVVRTGHPTEFRNSDDVLHNVRVREETTKAGTFNVAIPTGETYDHTFERDGFYDVGCDIHPGMSATIYATSTPYAVVADSDGRFTIPAVAPGAYTATVYAGTERIERAVEVAPGRTELTLIAP